MLQREQMEKIKRFGTSRNVTIEHISTGRVDHLKLHGTPHDIMKVYDMINKILDNIEKEEQRKREAEIYAKNVKWYFKDGEQYEEYEKEISAVIEQACQKGQPEVEFAINGEAIPLPPNWEPMAQDKPFILVTLDPSTSEYQNVKSAFIEKLDDTRNVVDIHIERVQNSKLYRQYMVLKQSMDARKSGVQSERNLYHGTKEKSSTLINATGFNRSFAGLNAVNYGKGSYFAVKSGYSAGRTYSPPDDNGYKYIYQCKVLTGEYARGKQDMMVPPPKNPNNPTICYDSVVDKMDNPTMFVVFNDALAYPEYLIKFKEV
ncbi:protein mono-ADP-ribosyltransferase PARP14-like [Ptychodera flava]|uniref:protein mono-ADP-ribosyltransferase PARP14-like n=1 Tax=Ptychodera flava TaxID=63121 RepID=UPI00396A8B48